MAPQIPELETHNCPYLSPICLYLFPISHLSCSPVKSDGNARELCSWSNLGLLSRTVSSMALCHLFSWSEFLPIILLLSLQTLSQSQNLCPHSYSLHLSYFHCPRFSITEYSGDFFLSLLWNSQVNPDKLILHTG